MKYLKDIKEVIKVPIEVGDVVLGGRFKNKKTVVKKIGKNKKGDITINDKPLLKYRIVKESISNFNDKVEYYLSHLSDDGFRIFTDECVDGVFLKIWKGTEQLSYRSSELFNYREISDDIHRFISNITSDFEIDHAYTMRRPHYWEEGYDDPITLNRQEYTEDDVVNDVDFGDIKVLYIRFSPLGVNEKINAKKFRDFINKYKSSGYISTKSIKTMKDEIGINYNDFKSISDSVHNLFKFFNKSDDDTFGDILQYVIDDMPVISHIGIERNVNVSSDSSMLMESFDFIINKSKSEIDVVDTIICWVDQLREAQIKKYNQRKEEDLAKRPGYIDHFTKYLLKRINHSNLYEELYINPGFVLKINLNNKVDWDQLTNADYDYNSEFKKNRRKVREEILDHIKSDDCLGRYLSAIGYGGLTYTTTMDTYSYGDFSDTFEIKVKINLEKK